MSKIDELIKKLEIALPTPPSPVGNYVAHTIVNNLVYISGQLPLNSKGELTLGKLGDNLTLEQGKEAAKLCILNSIGHLKNGAEGSRAAQVPKGFHCSWPGRAYSKPMAQYTKGGLS